jgi:hypothetical protein
LYFGFVAFLNYATSAGVITDQEQSEFDERCWDALQKVARAQRVRQEASEPAYRFLELLRAAISSFQGHVASLDGTEPPNPRQWGWQLIGTVPNERWAGAGMCIGWLDGANLYLEPTASFGLAQKIGQSTGEPLAVGEKTLRKRLEEKGLLASASPTRDSRTVRKTVQGRGIPVVHILASAITSPPAQFRAADAEKETFEC